MADSRSNEIVAGERGRSPRQGWHTKRAGVSHIYCIIRLSVSGPRWRAPSVDPRVVVSTARY